MMRNISLMLSSAVLSGIQSAEATGFLGFFSGSQPKVSTEHEVSTKLRKPKVCNDQALASDHNKKLSLCNDGTVIASPGQESECTLKTHIQKDMDATVDYRIFQFKPLLLAGCPKTSFGDEKKYEDTVNMIANDEFGFLDGVGDCFDTDGKMAKQGEVWLGNLALDTDLVKCPGQGAVKTVDRDRGCTVSFYGFGDEDMSRVYGNKVERSFLNRQIDSCLHVAVRIPYERAIDDIESETRATKSGVVTACFYPKYGGLFGSYYQEGAELQSASDVASGICRAIHVLRNDLLEPEQTLN